MGPQLHALPAVLDPGDPPPTPGLFDRQTWPTVTATPACGHVGTFRRGGYIHRDLGRCWGCCAATGTPDGFGVPPTATDAHPCPECKTTRCGDHLDDGHTHTRAEAAR